MSAAGDGKETVGFIGLGIMGAPMAENLLRAGYPLIVHNRSRGPVEKLAAVGARPAVSPREVAEQSDVMITMLPDSPHVIEVIEDVLPGSSFGDLLIDMSTIAPSATRRLAARAQEHGVRDA